MKIWLSNCFYDKYLIAAPSLAEAIVLSGLEHANRFRTFWQADVPMSYSTGVYLVPAEGELILCDPIPRVSGPQWRLKYGPPVQRTELMAREVPVSAEEGLAAPTLEDRARLADAVLVSQRFTLLVPRLDDAVERGDLGAICEVRDKMKEALNHA